MGPCGNCEQKCIKHQFADGFRFHVHVSPVTIGLASSSCGLPSSTQIEAIVGGRVLLSSGGRRIGRVLDALTAIGMQNRPNFRGWRGWLPLYFPESCALQTDRCTVT